MTDRPILQTAADVRAALAWRKTQARVILKLAGRLPDFIGPRGCEADPTCWGWEMPDGYFVTVEGDEKDHAPGWRNGWRDWIGAYAPGDRLWVREAHALLPATAYRMSIGTGTIAQVEHPTDGYTAAVFREGFDRSGHPRWRPSTQMPRWASRLTYIVTDVRVQRVQDITEADAIAEGIVPVTRRFPPLQGCLNQLRERTMYEWSGGWSVRAADAYAALWNSLHGPGAWDANPWVVALTFTVQRGNIDQLPGVAG